ncbi:MAG: D-aminoacylase [Alphaproteobacteria bacterium]|nr:D-aminoacylase [Alphaproteobacteria bacterium]MBU1513900.1 D-aminoacylase [Alphaproteobacteria bacterium]MBU2094166.1 D-aminoacylase [Alphaproteobacteria bacterium]MBU2150464.1 D-aminoacylase [Alphaproteobacteria bacterium]MBU2307656.1 D-aminoacylase [Alphaproteobacteria bacterium]
MRFRLALLAAAAALVSSPAGSADRYDLVVRGGQIYDGSGGAPVTGDVAIKGQRIVCLGVCKGSAAKVVDAKGKAVAPGFVNMLSWSTESLIADGRGLSELKQGVTLEVMGEGDSMGPLNPEMKRLGLQRQGDIKYPIAWTTLDEYLRFLEAKGVSMNVASFIGAATARIHVLGEDDVDPTPDQLARMRALVVKAMEDGAMGVGSSLIYAPGSYAETDELVALVTEAGRCGGFYISHMRSEGNRLEEAVDELISISRRSGAPAEIYHLKASGKPNWGKLDSVLARIEAARKDGLRITADMYTYPAGSTGLDAAMPTWVQAGGVEAWIARLKDPETRAKVKAEMIGEPVGFENLQRHAGAEGTLLVGFKNPKLKPLTGKTLAQVAAERGVSPQDAAIDLVIEDGSRVQVVYFLMDEANVARQTTLPWMSFGSDAEGQAPEGSFLLSSTHPRAYGNFSRLLAKYVRDEQRLTLSEAVRKLSALPAQNLGLHDRGMLKVGNYADVVVFDPATVQDHATFEKPQQFSTGVSEVVVNGQLALANGEPTAARPGQVVRGRGWTGWKDGGCRKSAKDWSW